MDISAFLHYSSLIFTVLLTTLGVGIGGGLASMSAIEAINIAPTSYSDIFQSTVIGLALIETGGIIGVIMSIILLMGQPLDVANFSYIALSEIGIPLSLGIGGFIVGLVSAIPVRQAVLTMTRQPFFGRNIMNMMLITLSIIQTPVIFGFLIALVIKTQASSLVSYPDALRGIAAGAAMGIGSIGPAIGLARFARTALEGIGINRNAYNAILPFSFISQAIIETPIIFCLIISVIILFSPLDTSESLMPLVSIFAASFAVSMSTISPGLSSGSVASSACKQIAYRPQYYSNISRLSIIAQGLIDAVAIYGLLIAFLILIF